MIVCDLFFMMPVIYLFVLFLINDMFPWFYIPAMVLFSIFFMFRMINMGVLKRCPNLKVK